jgi:SnoaL-like domain
MHGNDSNASPHEKTRAHCMSYVNQLRRYLAAYARKDLQAIEAMLDEGATLQDWNLVVTGKAEVLRETHNNFEAARSIEIEIKREFERGRDAAAELHIVIDGTVHLEVVDVVRFNARGLVESIKSYKG